MRLIASVWFRGKFWKLITPKSTVLAVTSENLSEFHEQCQVRLEITLKKSIFIYFKHFASAEILRFTDRLWMITRQSTFQACRGFSRFLRVWLWWGRLLISYKGNALKVWESSCSFATPLISFGHFFIFQDVYMCGGMRKHSTSDSRQPKDFFFPASLDLSLLKCK